MHQCHIKERNKSTSSLSKSESQFEFSTSCFLCLRSTSVICMSLHLCLPEGVSSVCILWLSLTKGFLLFLLYSWKESYGEGMRAALQESLTEFLQGIKSMAPNDHNWSRQEISSSISQYPFLEGFFPFLLCLLISGNDTRYLGQEYRRVHNLRLHLCLGCNSWPHRECKASKVDC